jgi:hypothetical protein
LQAKARRKNEAFEQNCAKLESGRKFSNDISDMLAVQENMAKLKTQAGYDEWQRNVFSPVSAAVTDSVNALVSGSGRSADGLVVHCCC